ncbi:MAG: tetratricopeptide repeat protein [Treponema sp.]|nr:tetratricopeptide repeat protein [Treponema sp.]MCL2250784.1 tetratricopeptide repeat protein [Treponema sp.]
MESVILLNNSAVALTEANKPFEAISLFQKALILEPENPMLWLNMGIAQQKTGEYNIAIESFRHSLTFDNNLTEAWYSLGLIYYEMNEFVLSENCYKSAILCNDNDPKIWNNLGVLYFNLEKNDAKTSLEQARECFEKALSLCPHFFDALYNLRDTCRELKDYRAAAEFERILSAFQDIDNK